MADVHVTVHKPSLAFSVVSVMAHREFGKIFSEFKKGGVHALTPIIDAESIPWFKSMVRASIARSIVATNVLAHENEKAADELRQTQPLGDDINSVLSKQYAKALFGAVVVETKGDIRSTMDEFYNWTPETSEELDLHRRIHHYIREDLM